VRALTASTSPALDLAGLIVALAVQQSTGETFETWAGGKPYGVADAFSRTLACCEARFEKEPHLLA